MSENTKQKLGYKKTALGWIPEEWEVLRLGDWGKTSTGNTPPTNDPRNYGDEFLFVSPGDLGYGKYVYESSKKLSEKGFSKSRKFPTGSILFTCIGSTIGKLGIATMELTSNQQINAVFVNENNNNEYLYYCLENEVPQIRLLAGEQAVPIINKSQFDAILIKRPPLPEQRAIAGVLGCWDKAIGTLSALIAQKQARKKWLMQVLLTGKRRLTGFSDGSENGRGAWRTVRLGDVFEERVETGRGDLKLLSISGSLGVVDRDSMEKRDSSNEDKSKYRRIAPGDIGYNTMRLWQGVASLSTLEGIVSPAYTIIIPKDSIDGQYMSYLFKTESMINKFYMHSQGLVDDTRNCKYPHFAEIKVAIPPKKEQLQIAKVLNLSDQEIRLLETQLTSLKVQKKGLMQELLTGRKRMATKN